METEVEVDWEVLDVLIEVEVEELVDEVETEVEVEELVELVEVDCDVELVEIEVLVELDVELVDVVVASGPVLRLSIVTDLGVEASTVKSIILLVIENGVGVEVKLV